MSDNALAIIRIGGRLEQSRARILLDAINDTYVFPHEGDIYFEPRSVADLLATLDDEGHFQLTDDSAPWGEMPAITKACHELGLSYRLWSEAVGDHGSEVRVCTPGMDQPLVFQGNHMDSDAILVDSKVVIEALASLRDRRLRDAEELLEKAVPEMPELPSFGVTDNAAIFGTRKICCEPETASQVAR